MALRNRALRRLRIREYRSSCSVSFKSEPGAKRPGTDVQSPLKCSAHAFLGPESRTFGDLERGKSGRAQHSTRRIEPQLFDVARRRLTGLGQEFPRKTALGHVGACGQCSDVQILS